MAAAGGAATQPGRMDAEVSNQLSQLLLFGLLIGLGTLDNRLGNFARKTIGTEDIRVSGQWWDMMNNTELRWGVVLYIAVFAAGAHGGGVMLGEAGLQLGHLRLVRFALSFRVDVAEVVRTLAKAGDKAEAGGDKPVDIRKMDMDDLKAEVRRRHH